jgi:hypothetical protein
MEKYDGISLKSNIEWVLVVIHKYGVSFLLGISSGPL